MPSGPNTTSGLLWGLQWVIVPSKALISPSVKRMLAELVSGVLPRSEIPGPPSVSSHSSHLFPEIRQGQALKSRQSLWSAISLIALRKRHISIHTQLGRTPFFWDDMKMGNAAILKPLDVRLLFENLKRK